MLVDLGMLVDIRYDTWHRRNVKYHTCPGHFPTTVLTWLVVKMLLFYGEFGDILRRFNLSLNNLALSSLSRGERTGSQVPYWVWSYLLGAACAGD